MPGWLLLILRGSVGYVLPCARPADVDHTFPRGGRFASRNAESRPALT